MRKTVLTILALLIFICTPLLSQTNDCEQAYVKAMTAQTNDEKARLLKEWLRTCAGKGNQYEKYAYSELCLIPYSGKTIKDAIDYGEKAIQIGGHDDFTKCRVLSVLAGVYIQTGQNLGKAKNYALQVIQIGEKNRTEETSPEDSATWGKLIGAAYYAHAQALEKERDPRGALESYIKSYEHLKNPQIANDLKKIGKHLYDFKFYKEAERAFKITAQAIQDYPSIYFYAASLHRNGKKEEALKQYKLAYSKQKSGDAAYNIGILLAKNAEKDTSVVDEAIRYLLEASMLSPSKSKQAMQTAEHLYFNIKDSQYNAKVKELQNKTLELQEITENYNKRFGDKEDDELSEADKRIADVMLKDIDELQESIKKIQEDQKNSLEKFNQLIADAKRRLGAR